MAATSIGMNHPALLAATPPNAVIPPVNALLMLICFIRSWLLKIDVTCYALTKVVIAILSEIQ